MTALLASDSSEYKRTFKIVRRDSLADVGEDCIVAADEATGECTVEIGGETKTLSFGADGIRIITRGRRG